MHRALVRSAGFLTTLAACTNDSGSAPTGSAEAAATSMKYYDCEIERPGGTLPTTANLSKFELGVGTDTLELTDLAEDALPPATGRRVGPVGYEFFIGFEQLLGLPRKIHSPFSRGAGTASIASLEVDLLHRLGWEGGKLEIRRTSQNGDVDTTSHYCRQKRDKYRVVEQAPVSLACTVPVLNCHEDNLVDSNCPYLLRVNQTADGAEMRIIYPYLMRVPIPNRNLKSTVLSRTALAFEGTWKDEERTWNLKLKYRAGFTYTGALSLPNGVTTDIQCNDTSMEEPRGGSNPWSD